MYEAEVAVVPEAFAYVKCGNGVRKLCIRLIPGCVAVNNELEHEGE
jgi:hypothetical protein